MKNKPILIAGIFSIVVCISTIIDYSTRISVFGTIIIIIELLCGIMLLRLWLKANNKKLSLEIIKTPFSVIILKHIPGFRSGEKVNMIFASIYYILFILLIIIDLFLGRRFISIAGSALVMPFLLFAMSDHLSEK